MKNNGITEYFEGVETEEEYNGYFCRIPEVITIAILGSICGLIGNMDMLITAQAKSEDLIVVTHNTREFERVEGLQLEDWFE